MDLSSLLADAWHCFSWFLAGCVFTVICLCCLISLFHASHFAQGEKSRGGQSARTVRREGGELPGMADD
jgi:hypothetical protein